MACRLATVQRAHAVNDFVDALAKEVEGHKTHRLEDLLSATQKRTSEWLSPALQAATLLDPHLLWWSRAARSGDVEPPAHCDLEVKWMLIDNNRL